MLMSVPLDDQVGAIHGDRLRVLVVGAGVAGVTLAQLLRRQGLHPVVLERSASATGAGYMLGLMPLVDEPLQQLGVWQQYRQRSVAMHRYQLRSSRGRAVRTYSVDAVLAQYGRYGGIERDELMETITGDGIPATLDSTVTALEQRDDDVTATMRAGEDIRSARFDLVVAADGMHSTTRGLVLDPREVESFDTGWGGWVAWAKSDPGTNDLYAETWGRGFFLGRYPVRERVGVFVGGPGPATAAGVGPFVSEVRTRLHQIDPLSSQALAVVEQADNPYLWQFTDTRSSRWTRGRVILLGDAAAGFLPTAGIGAAMAMESAAVLAGRLSTVSADEIPATLRGYELAQRPRVLAAHKNSRQLARMMFRDGRVICTLRDIAMRAATLKMALGPSIKLHQSAPLLKPDRRGAS